MRRAKGWLALCAWVGTQMAEDIKRANEEFNRIDDLVPRVHVENVNWHFDHDYEWKVTYAYMVGDHSMSWSYGWRRPARWERLPWA